MMVRPLVVDLINQVQARVGVYASRRTHLSKWCVRVQRSIAKLKMLAEHAGREPVMVVNAYWTGKESSPAWRKECEKAYRRGYKGRPASASAIISELAQRIVGHVVLEPRLNAFDVMATLAGDGGIVLSGDTQFFRLFGTLLRDRVFVATTLDHPWRVGPASAWASPNYVNADRLLGGFEPHLLRDPTKLHRLLFLHENDLFVRGSTYPLAEKVGHTSLLLASRRYRQTLYDGPVREVFPVFNKWGGHVDWVDEIVEPAAAAVAADAEKTSIIGDDPIALANALLDATGGRYDAGHGETALVLACELVASHRGTSLLDELARCGIIVRTVDNPGHREKDTRWAAESATLLSKTRAGVSEDPGGGEAM